MQLPCSATNKNNWTSLQTPQTNKQLEASAFFLNLPASSGLLWSWFCENVFIGPRIRRYSAQKRTYIRPIFVQFQKEFNHFAGMQHRLPPPIPCYIIALYCREFKALLLQILTTRREGREDILKNALYLQIFNIRKRRRQETWGRSPAWQQPIVSSGQYCHKNLTRIIKYIIINVLTTGLQILFEASMFEFNFHCTTIYGSVCAGWEKMAV